MKRQQLCGPKLHLHLTEKLALDLGGGENEGQSKCTERLGRERDSNTEKNRQYRLWIELKKRVRLRSTEKSKSPSLIKRTFQYSKSWNNCIT